MDHTNAVLESLLDKTDQAFKRLMQDPQSFELHNAYENAKGELDVYLVDMRNSLKKRYKDF